MPSGEICGWVFDAEGRFLKGARRERTASAPIPSSDRAVVVALAKGRKKLPGIRAAVRGGIVNGLITDEATAEALLAASA